MKLIIKLILIFCLSVITISCSKKENRNERLAISGEITGFPDGTKLYLKNLSTDIIIDSTFIENNNFKLESYLLNEPERLVLSTTLDEKYFFSYLLIGNENISIKGDIDGFFNNLNIKGSKTQENYKDYKNITKKYDIKRDSIITTFFKLPIKERKKIEEKFQQEKRKIDSTRSKLLINYVKSHPKTYSSVIELGLLKNKLPKDTIQKIFNNYTPEIKKSKYGKIIEFFLRENVSKIGDKYYDFKGLNQKGESVKFSNLKGEYTLINFTNAYCGYCIQSADELIEVNKKYSDSLTIVNFSLNVNKNVWLNSLKRDKVTWNSIWDGQGSLYSETSIKYGIVIYPTFVLINSKGTIIDKWTGYNKSEIINRLDESLFKNHSSQQKL